MRALPTLNQSMVYHTPGNASGSAGKIPTASISPLTRQEIFAGSWETLRLKQQIASLTLGRPGVKHVSLVLDFRSQEECEHLKVCLFLLHMLTTVYKESRYRL